MSSDRSSVEMMGVGLGLGGLQFDERIRVVRKLALTIETLILLKKPETVQVTNPVPPETLELLVLGYVRLGHLSRREPQDLIQALILLTRCHPVPIYPVSFENKGDEEFEQFLQTMGEEESELAVELLDLFQKILSDGLLSLEYAAAYVADALVNYKTTSKKFQKYQKHIQTLLQQDLHPSAISSSPT